MCGVVGYIGEKNCIDIIYNGLKTLEYRGYDSSGIATLEKGKIYLAKTKGKLAVLKDLLSELPKESKSGIGHTRWATHGAALTHNAHPHQNEEFAIVHNGIIENYLELKNSLIVEGYKFSSQTDTEVILHLIDSLHRKSKQPLFDTLLNLSKKLLGSYAIGVLDRNNPDEIYILKNGSPAVVGLGENENFFASDAYALVLHTNKAVYLQDEQIAVLSKNDCKVFGFDGSPVKYRITQLEWNQSSLDKQGFKHYMLKEIYEQPAVISGMIERFIDWNHMSFKDQELGIDRLDFKNLENVYIVACGSAYYAGVTAKYFMEHLINAPIQVELASEFRYRRPFLRENDLLIAVSQSGETLDTLTCVKYAKEHKTTVLAVCNVEQSSIARSSDITCYMNAGPEIGVASTKGFTAQILSLYFMALAVAKKRNIISTSDLANRMNEIKKLPALAEQAINEASNIEEVAGKFYQAKNFIFIGRGASSAIAYEGALKLKEISYIHAEGYPGGELKHGPIALIDSKTPTLALVPDDSYLEKMQANIEEIKAREGRVVIVGNKNSRARVNEEDSLIHQPSSSDMACQAILSTIPLQLFSYFVAMRLGTDIDQPRNLAKSVTVE